jgi:hypothetical protein
MNDRGQVVGKLGHLAFLRGVDPGYERQVDLAALDRAGVDRELIESISGHMRFWQEDLIACCHRAAHLRVGDVMRQVDEAIEQDSPLTTAISTMVRLQTLSIPVRRGDEVVGLLRLADVYDIVATVMTGQRSGGADTEDE